VFEQDALRGNELLAQATVQVACVNREFSPARLPAILNERLATAR